ncbi:MAG: GerMN domain-containing protein [Eubacteriales bacterium]|jgi:spore germination protein GerM
MFSQLCSLALCAVLFFTGGCGTAPVTPTASVNLTQSEFTLCFVAQNRNQSEDLMYSETRTIAYDPAAGPESYVLQALFAGPESSKGLNVIPSNLAVKELQKQDGTLLIILTFSGEKPRESFDFRLVKTSVAMTMLELEDVRQVGVYMDEVEYDASGMPADLFRKEDVITPDTLNEITELPVTLYLPDTKTGTLVPTSRNITSGSETSILSAVVAEVWKTTDANNPTRSLYNQNARLLSVFREDGVVYLNFSEAIEAADSPPAQVSLCIYGLINSICALDETYSVSLLVKGKPYDSYMQYTQMEVFVFNQSLVGEPTA